MQQADFNERVSAEIRAEMGRKRMTQEELARRIGWQGSQLSRRLSGLIQFRTAEVESIARALDVPLDQLMSPRALAG